MRTLYEKDIEWVAREIALFCFDTEDRWKEYIGLAITILQRIVPMPPTIRKGEE